MRKQVIGRLNSNAQLSVCSCTNTYVDCGLQELCVVCELRRKLDGFIYFQSNIQHFENLRGLVVLSAFKLLCYIISQQSLFKNEKNRHIVHLSFDTASICAVMSSLCASQPQLIDLHHALLLSIQHFQ